MGVLFLPETLKRNQPPQDRATAQRSSDAETLLEDGEARAALSDSSNGSSSSLDLAAAASAPTAKTTTLLEWFKSLQIVHLLSRRKVAVAVGLYMILGFADVMFEEVFPLWSLNTPQLGGLGFLPFNIGMTTAIGSLLLLAWNAFGYPLLESKFRPLGCFQLAYSIIVPALIVYPSVHYLVPFGTVILWAGVMAATFTYFIASSTAYMSVFILIANCAPSQNLSRVNGVAQTGVAIGRTISPILGGSLLAWSLNNGLTYPLNFYFVFGFMAFAHACGACLSFLLPPTINERAPLSELVT